MNLREVLIEVRDELLDALGDPLFWLVHVPFGLPFVIGILALMMITAEGILEIFQ